MTEKLAVLLAAGAVLLVGCGEPAEPKEAAPVAAPRFEGLIVAGTPADAKASGFTECVSEGNGYYGFSCSKPGATIMGVRPLRASVRLTYPADYAYDAVRTPDKTSYDGIGYSFAPPTDYGSTGCNYIPENPYACYEDQAQPLPTLVRTLTEAGWMGRGERRGGATYVKPGRPFVITFPNRDHYEEIGGRRILISEVTVRQVAPKEVAEIVSAIRSERSASTAKVESTVAFIENMKGG